MIRSLGAVIDLAFYQGGASELRLGEEFQHNGLTVRCAQIGLVPRGTSHAWSRARLARETIELMHEKGDALINTLVTHNVSLDDAPCFVNHLVDKRPDFLQVVFNVSH